MASKPPVPLDASPGAPDQPIPWPVLVISAICALVLAAAAYFGWMLLTIPPGTDGDTKVLGSVLGLVGVVATGVISLAGIVLKHSIDVQSATLARQAELRLRIESEHNRKVRDQTERRLEIEAEHNQRLASQAEDRLRLETAIQAVSMMSTSDGKPASDGQKAGALFALATLNQLDFALALLENMWAKDEIDQVSAVWLINRGLLAGPELETVAVNILRDNVHKLHRKDGNHAWPECLESNWRPTLTEYTRERLLEILFQVVALLPRAEWREGFLITMLKTFYVIAITDPSRRIQQGAALGLRILRLALDLKGHETIYTTRDPLRLSDVIEVENKILDPDAQSHEDRATTNLLDLARALEVWAGLAPQPAAERRGLPMNPATAADRGDPQPEISGESGRA